VVPSGATQVVVATTATDTTVTLTARVDGVTDATALLWAARDIDPSSAAPVPTDDLERIEAFTRPRLEELGCDDLAEVTYAYTVDGCQVAPPREEVPDDTLVFAVDEVVPDREWSTVGVDAQVLAATEVETWLATNDLALSDDMAAALQLWLDEGADVLAVRPVAPLAPGTWLPPIRVRIDGPPQALPLIGAADADRPHDLLVLGLSSEEQGTLTVVNYPVATADPTCMLPPGTSLEERYDEVVDTLAQAPPQVLEAYAGPAATCLPCAGDPLLDTHLADVGLVAEATSTWMTRTRMRWAPGQLDADPRLSLSGRRVPQQLAWVAYEEGLEFALPRCDVGIPADPGVCPGVQPDAAGCSLGPRAPVGLLPLGLVVLGLRRRRTPPAALLAVVALSVSPTARAAEHLDRAPRTELHVALPVFSTERIVLDGLDKGAPYWGNPLLGLEVRQVLVPWKDGANVGVIADVRGFRGRARVPDSPVRFSLWEPAVGIDARHGHLREGHLLSPKLRYGAQLALAVQDSTAWRPRATLGFKALVGAGAWVGSGPRQWSVEARASVVPRTDGYDTTFLPQTGLPGWQYSAGSAVVQLMVGGALY
jgi:hypothetical protein